MRVVMRVVVFVIPMVMMSCGRPADRTRHDWTPTTADDLGGVVARVGDVPIFAAEVREQAERSGETTRAAVERIIAFHLLAAAARESGVQPLKGEFDRGRRQALVERLIEREFEPGARREDVPEGELRAGYERARHLFVHSRLVEVVVLAVYTGARMKPEPRAVARKTAEELESALRARPDRTADDFLVVANDPSWAERGVKYVKTLQSLDRPFSAKVGAAFQKLKAAGETTGVVEDETGLYIARYVGEKAPLQRTFEDARGELTESYYPIWRRQRFELFASAISERQVARVLQAAGANRR